jgi:hypothetical protein
MNAMQASDDVVVNLVPVPVPVPVVHAQVIVIYKGLYSCCCHSIGRATVPINNQQSTAAHNICTDPDRLIVRG